MIKKAYLVAVSIVLLAIVTIVALGANDVKSKQNETTSVYATTKETSETPSEEPEEITETETEITTPTAVSKETIVDVSTITTDNLQADDSDKKKTYTDDDLYYLAAAVCREAGGSSEEIQLLVANVVINRVNSSLYPDTIYDVLTDYRQYGMMWKYGVSFPSWATHEVIDQCYSVAKRILDGERFCPENVLFQAEFEQGSGIYKHIDGFYFCYYG